MSPTQVLVQQLITGLSNGLIISLIALGYTLVYGILELINFAHGDLFMLGAFFALSVVGILGAQLGHNETLSLILIFGLTPVFCAGLNFIIEKLAYKPLRNSPKLAPLVTAIGVSFILLNIGLFWGGLPMEVFGYGRSASAPKDFPALIPNTNIFGEHPIHVSIRDLVIFLLVGITLIILTYIVKFTKTGKAMRAVAQNPMAARLMGINVDKIIGIAFLLGGALGGLASVVYSLYNNTIHFQMGFRVGIDAFTAAVLGGIGSLPGAVIGGVFLGITRALSDQYIETRWTNVIVFSILVLVLVFKPSGLLGIKIQEKV